MRIFMLSKIKDSIGDGVRGFYVVNIKLTGRAIAPSG